MKPIRPELAQSGYSVPTTGTPTDLNLSANLGTWPVPDLPEVDPEVLRAYPSAGALEALLAERHGVDPEQVIVTAGGDDAIDRLIRVFVGPGREVVLPSPGFAMIPIYTRVAGGGLVEVPWLSGAFPVAETLQGVTERTGMVVVTSPNNPTGNVATEDELRAVAAGASDAVVLVDLAYAEFADVDLTDVALQYDNCVVVRSFSKAWGLAGLRVGYAIGPAEVIGWLRGAAAPYSVSALSVALVAQQVRDATQRMEDHVLAVREQVPALVEVLEACGIETQPSQANFVLCRPPDPDWLRDGLAGLGIKVRVFPGHPILGDRVRIGVPGDPADFERLVSALRAVCQPEALILDMDGVIADVRGSFREAILQTAAHFGLDLTLEDIARAKTEGDANNDWVLTTRLLKSAGIEANLDAVTEVFEDLYQGGLHERETLISPAFPGDPSFGVRTLPFPFSGGVGIVTGRPRADAVRFLERFDLRPAALVCMEDAPAKPDPAPVRLCLEQLGVSRAWMVGDTPDDIRAARSAGVVPIGVVAPGEDPDLIRPALIAAGAARVISSLEGLP